MKCNTFFTPTVRLTAAVLAAFFVFAAPVFLQGQSCMENWSRPVVCGIKIGVSIDGDDWDTVRPGSRIEVPVGGTVELQFQAVDQSGWEFPEDRLMVGMDEEMGFKTYFSIEKQTANRVRLRARGEQGQTRIRFWIPGNLNLEWDLSFEVGALKTYSRSQSEYVVRGLYRAILGREVDAGALGPAVMEVQRGRTKKLVDSMFYSPEFEKKRRSLTPAKLLDQFFDGLLKRRPNSDDVRTFLRRLEKKKYSETIMRIIHSEEYQKRLMSR